VVERIRAGTGASLLLIGDAGVGKTALLRYAADRAGGLRVLAAQGVSAESSLPFAGLHELLGPVLGGLPGLPPRQSEALAAGFALSPRAAEDVFAIGAGTLGLLTAAAAAGSAPVLVLVDDLERWDDTSRRALLFAARRTARERLGIVLATTEVHEFGVPSQRVTPLDGSASRALLRSSCPEPLCPAVLDDLAEAAAGVPIALAELPGLLTREQLAGEEPLPDPPPVGDGVRRAFGPRLAGFSRETRAALVVAAAAGPIGLGPTLAALDALGLCADALEPAEAAAEVKLDSRGVEFTYPMVRALAYRDAPVAARRAAHRALAAVTTELARAWHLGLAALGPDESTADALESAATAADGRIPVGRAAQLVARAAELTSDDLPQARRCVRAAELWQLAGVVRPELPHRAAELTDDLRVRARALAATARDDALRGRPAAAHRVLIREAARVRGLDPDAAAAMLLDASRLAVERRAALSDARWAAHAAARGPAPLRAACVVRQAAVLARDGQLEQARGLLAALGDTLDLPALGGLGMPPTLAAGWWWLADLPALLGRLGQTGTALRMLDDATNQARAVTAHGILPGLLVAQAQLALATGDWELARSSAVEAAELATPHGQAADAGPALAVLAWLEAARGRRPECERYLARARDLDLTSSVAGLGPSIAAAAGRLELSLGRPEVAFARLAGVLRRVEAGATPERGVEPWLSDLVEAAVGAGRRDEARRMLAAARRHRADALLPAGALARCAALLATEPAEAEAAFGRAVAAEGDAAFERGRSLLCHGEWLLDRGRDDEAAERLREARGVFEALDVPSWVARATHDPRDADAPEPAAGGVPAATAARAGGPPAAADPGPRPAHWGELTTQEQRVTMLVGRGATNREAATALFLSPKTIEFHLRGVYRKLGVRSRAELALLVGEGHLREPRA